MLNLSPTPSSSRRQAAGSRPSRRVGPGGGIAFGVADSGIGIAPEDQARVFKSFGQGRHDVAITDKGTGLGLPIAQGLIEAHGGTIALESGRHRHGVTA